MKKPLELSLWSHDPYTSLRSEMDDLLSHFRQDWTAMNGGEFTPSMNLAETDQHVEVTVDLPGIHPHDVDVEVLGDELRIRGKREEAHEEKEKSFHRVERRTGQFFRRIGLPCAVNPSNVEAHFDKGVLTIQLPKAAEAQTQKIPVKCRE